MPVNWIACESCGGIILAACPHCEAASEQAETDRAADADDIASAWIDLGGEG